MVDICRSNVSVMGSYCRFYQLASLVESCASLRDLQGNEMRRVAGWARMSRKRERMIQSILGFVQDLVQSDTPADVADGIRRLADYLRSPRSSADLEMYLGRQRMSEKLKAILEVCGEFA